ncbi:MAG: hypothetical protein QM804_12635 [Propionicimonas sp.]
MDEDDEPVYVNNPYRAAIEARGAASTDACDDLRAILGDAISAFQGGAWVGGRADATYLEITQLQLDASMVADGVADEFSDAAGAQPQKVLSTAWQVHWRNLR